MLVQDFSERAEECLRLSQQTTSPHDRDFFIEMARAWYGMADEPPQATTPSKPH